MPLRQTAGNGFAEYGIRQILRLGDATGDEAVEHAVGKAGEKSGSEVVFHEQLVVGGLALAVNQNVGAVAIGAKEDGLAVNVGLGQARAAVDSLEQGVCDAVGEADKLDIVVGPVRRNGVYELEGGSLGVGGVVGEGNEAHMAGARADGSGSHGWGEYGRQRDGKRSRQFRRGAGGKRKLGSRGWQRNQRRVA